MTPVERITKSQDAVKVLVATTTADPPPAVDIPVTADGDRRILRFGHYLPKAAAGAADIQEIAGLKGLPFTPAQFRELNDRVRTDEIIMMQTAAGFQTMHSAHQRRKDTLCQWTTLVADTVRFTLDNPTTPKADREALEVQGRPLLQIISDYNNSVQGQKDKLQRLRDDSAEALAKAQSYTEAAQATTGVLRGNDLSPQSLPGKTARGSVR